MATMVASSLEVVAENAWREWKDVTVNDPVPDLFPRNTFGEETAYVEWRSVRL
jgi:hypothetical protein